MKFYKARSWSKACANKYLMENKDYQYGKNGEITLYHCYIRDKIAHVEPASFNITEEELRWNYIECGEIECNGTKNSLY